MKTNTEPICKSVFRDGRSEPTRECFTQAWIHLINELERNKETANILIHTTQGH